MIAMNLATTGKEYSFIKASIRMRQFKRLQHIMYSMCAYMAENILKAYLKIIYKISRHHHS